MSHAVKHMSEKRDQKRQRSLFLINQTATGRKYQESQSRSGDGDKPCAAVRKACLYAKSPNSSVTPSPSSDVVLVSLCMKGCRDETRSKPSFYDAIRQQV